MVQIGVGSDITLDIQRCHELGSSQTSWAISMTSFNDDAFPGNSTALEGLKDAVKNNKLVGLVGAGASAPLYPTWYPLLKSLVLLAEKSGSITGADVVAEYESQIETDPLDIALMLENRLGKHNFRHEVSRRFRPSEINYTNVHSLIAQIGMKGIVTTNYDDGLEAAYAHYYHKSMNVISPSDRSELTRWLQGDIYEGNNCPILHLHGTIKNSQGMIFTGADYDRFYSDELNLNFIRRLWQAETVLAIGYGFADPFLNRGAEQALRGIESGDRHFAIIACKAGATVSQIRREQFSRKYRLKPIFYAIKTNQDGSEDHSGLSDILLDLIPKRESTPDESPYNPQINIPAKLNWSEMKQTGKYRREFESGLFVAPNGKTLYVEPNLNQPQGLDDELSEFTRYSVSEILSDELSYVISSRSECGATTLAKRLAAELSENNKPFYICDADEMPAYKHKIVNLLKDHVVTQAGTGVLIIDGFDADRHERMIREVLTLKIFSKYVLISSSSMVRDTVSLLSKYQSNIAKLLTLDTMSRSDVRTLGSLLFDTGNDDFISMVVEKVYEDLLGLCIPLTPSNVIMYLRILYKENDFYPLNRVQIIERYLTEVLRKAGDDYNTGFSARDKMLFISHFCFGRHERGLFDFRDSDWTHFAQSYQSETLIHFSYRELLIDLLSKKIIAVNSGIYYFRYKLFYTYFVGCRISASRELTQQYVENDRILEMDGLVEVVSATASDNSSFIEMLTLKLDASINRFYAVYPLEGFDPFADAKWSSNGNEVKEFWEPLSKTIEAGPLESQAIDTLKQSLVAEQRTEDQTIVVRQFDELERKLVAYHTSLVDAVTGSSISSGHIKLRAVETILTGYQVVYQVAFIYAPVIAQHSAYVWNGLVFTNNLRYRPGMTAEEKLSMVYPAIVRAVARVSTNRLASKKLGPVFKHISVNSKLEGFKRLLNFNFILRSKPVEWYAIGVSIIRHTGKDDFYLWTMLERTLSQFKQEVNTHSEREGLKRLVAEIRVRRDLRNNNPSVKLINEALKQLDERNTFSEDSKEDT